LKGTMEIKSLLAAPNDPPVQVILEAGILSKLIEFLPSDRDRLVYESCRALCNIACFRAEAVIEFGSLEMLPEIVQNIETCFCTR
jgi:hypothetical protein